MVDSSKSIQHKIKLEQGFQVIMPKQPYESQKKIIQKLFTAFSNCQNALIQSGTGTGKTLALLTGSIGWLQSFKLGVKIIYLSRTHSQLKQVVQQLKCIPYNPRVLVYGSRQQLCCNSNINNTASSFLDLKCSQLRKKGGCPYYQNLIPKELPKLLDIQGLYQVGIKNRCCPYYLARKMIQDSDIIFMPFNYMLDQRVFNCNQFKLQDMVLIFDEAHNIDKIAQQGYSNYISHQGLNLAQRQIRILIQSADKIMDKKSIFIPRQILFQARSIVKAILSGLVKGKPKLFTIITGLQSLKKLTHLQVQGLCGQTFQGLGQDNLQQSIQILQKVCDFSRKSNLDIQNLQNLHQWIKKLNVLYIDSQRQKKYRLGIIQNQSNKSWVLLCLSASQAFHKLQKCRSIVLTSGTLQPIEDWQHQLNIQFRHTLKLGCFITKQHALVGIATQFMPHQKFDWSFGKQSHDMLNTLLQQSSAVIPNGIVACFASYRLLNQFIVYLQKKGIKSYNKKPIFFQTKHQRQMSIAFNQFSIQATNKGALMCCVLKGKLAQGIDLAQNLCRGLIIVGIPFSPIHCLKIQQKKVFLLSQGKNPQAWYQSQAMRAVCQAMGRAVRSKNDYGIIILADHRYSRLQLQQRLPSWAKGQNSLLKWRSVMDMRLSLSSFFTDHKQQINQEQQNVVQKQQLQIRLQQRQQAKYSKVQTEIILNNKQQVHQKQKTTNKVGLKKQIQICKQIDRKQLIISGLRAKY